MSTKRCCAHQCFNSSSYTKNIYYFCFPKHKQFADQWADLCGRSDLKQKPLTSITKYYLCSEHFTAKCFVDPETRQKLKRELPLMIAMPSIFKNNLQEAMHIVNPKQSIEVHNIVLLDSDSEADDNDNITDFINFKKEETHYFEKTRFNAIDEDETVPLQENDKNIEVRRDVDNKTSEYIEDYILENESEQEKNIDISKSIEYEEKKCRLCLKELHDDEVITKFESSSSLQEFIKRIMSDKIAVGDEFSQLVCKNCENNALLCLIIVQNMDVSQEKIISPPEAFK